MISPRQAGILQSWVSPFLSLLFVGSFALGAGLIIWNTAFGENPLANAMSEAIVRNTQLPDDY